MSIVIGLVKEIKSGESRVALTPVGVQDLVQKGFKVKVEESAGEAIGYSDIDYKKAGAIIASNAEVFEKCDMLVKVKEPQAKERAMLRPNQIIFSYLHLASDKPQTEDLLSKKVTGIAFETIDDKNGRLPLLTPMSDIAGKLAVQQGAYFLCKPMGGSGVLLCGSAGARKGKVLIIGGGVVGESAANIAIGMGADVTIIDSSADRLRDLARIFNNRVNVLSSNIKNITDCLKEADLVIGAVLVVGAAAPKLVTSEMLEIMKPGSVIVDVAIDQGGCFETSKATTHAEPVFKVKDIVHYCVANMPGAVSQTSSLALESAILPYISKIAKDPMGVIKNDIHIRRGVNTFNGKLVNKAVSEAVGIEYTNIETLL